MASFIFDAVRNLLTRIKFGTHPKRLSTPLVPEVPEMDSLLFVACFTVAVRRMSYFE